MRLVSSRAAARSRSRADGRVSTAAAQICGPNPSSGRFTVPAAKRQLHARVQQVVMSAGGMQAGGSNAQTVLVRVLGGLRGVLVEGGWSRG